MSGRRLGVGVLAACTVLSSAPATRAACNLIPQAVQTYRAGRGTANRPYAAPGANTTYSPPIPRRVAASGGGVTLA